MSRVLLVFFAVILAVLSSLPMASAKAGKARQDAPPQSMDPMRIAIVRENVAGCEPNCAEWIMMQGDIMAESVPLFRRVLKLAGKRRLPIFVNSRGGKVDAGMALGQLIRASHLDVTVSKTVLIPCDPADRKCSDKALTGRAGSPMSYAAECASSCAFLLAAGVTRHVPYTTFVGLHQFTYYLTTTHYMNTYLNRKALVNGHMVVVSQKLVKQKLISKTTEKVATPKTTYDRAARFFAEMGIADNVNAIIAATPANGIHWLSADELAQTRIMTDRQDGISQILAIATQLGGKSAEVAALPQASHPVSTTTVRPLPAITTQSSADMPPAAPEPLKTYVSADIDLPIGRYRGTEVTADVAIHQRLGMPTVLLDVTPRTAAGPVTTTNLLAGVRINEASRRESLLDPVPGSLRSLSVTIPVAEFCTLRQQDSLAIDLQAAGPGTDFEDGRIVIQTESRFPAAHAVLAAICSRAEAAN
jgi:hypothetical protein